MLLPWVGSLMVLAATGAAAALPPELQQSLARAGVPPGAVSVLVRELPTAAGASPRGRDRIRHRAEVAMNPASLMKLVTTYAALDMLGPDFTWSNRVWVDGPVVDGVLRGNLILQGSGDPKLVLERLDALLRQIQVAGILAIQGDIVLDASVFALPPHNPARFDDEPLRPYNTAPDGLLVNFKSLIFRFTPTPDGALATVAHEPPIAGVTIPANVRLASGPCGDWRGQLQADFSDPREVRFGGSYPATCGERSWPVAWVEPQTYASRVVHAMWSAIGGQLYGRVREGATPPSARLLLSQPSLPLSEIVADVNKFSNNVMAQQVFLTLSAQTGGRGSFDGSRQRLRDWWRQRFAPDGEPHIENGSGLSRLERSSAASLGALLERAAAGPHGAVFEASLPLAGVDGTMARLRDRQPEALAIGNARIKTGSLRDVAAVAGFATGQSGTRYSVVAIINHPQAAAARPTLDRLLDWVIRDR
ncbi:MAG: D-alanyl-D-alanine carboxypeptidase/D-alanyl-D-alanine-endopeptidase [Burkholderiaceae bacterium]|jgi:D-alanyl-D-alanine carboxypeptidase/D-alanyl-D-alanine-endopeptidase (penicillin-binding protein 4)|nr:D-alanyl-D-alanine carboxypeptidase/D-alanyl-D-alanine-endopeptidase [Burkholderiaceae bacterium]